MAGGEGAKQDCPGQEGRNLGSGMREAYSGDLFLLILAVSESKVE